MKSAIAIKRYLEAEPNGEKVTASELADFKKACTPTEWDELGQQACAVLGVEWEPTARAES